MQAAEHTGLPLHEHWAAHPWPLARMSRRSLRAPLTPRDMGVRTPLSPGPLPDGLLGLDANTSACGGHLREVRGRVRLHGPHGRGGEAAARCPRRFLTRHRFGGRSAWPCASFQCGALGSKHTHRSHALCLADTPTDWQVCAWGGTPRGAKSGGLTQDLMDESGSTALPPAEPQHYIPTGRTTGVVSTVKGVAAQTSSCASLVAPRCQQSHSRKRPTMSMASMAPMPMISAPHHFSAARGCAVLGAAPGARVARSIQRVQGRWARPRMRSRGV